MAHIANDYQERDSARLEMGAVTGYGMLFHDHTRKYGLNGAGSGQKLGKHGHCKIVIVADWNMMEDLECETIIEQCQMTGQCGAVSCKNVPPDCLVDMFAAAHVSMMEIVPEDPNTSEGWNEANRMAHIANDYQESDSARLEMGAVTGFGMLFHDHTRIM